MGGKCSPSGGIFKQFGGTRIKQKDGVPNSRIDLYPDEDHQSPDDKITSMWIDEDGWAEWARDFTDHNQPQAHPVVPHDHRWHWPNKLDIPERSKHWEQPNPDFC